MNAPPRGSTMGSQRAMAPADEPGAGQVQSTPEAAPLSESGALLAAMPRATLLPVDSAGHLSHLERPDVVVPGAVRFLRAQP